MSCPKIKICGLFRSLDANYVNDAVPDYAGFVFYQKSHRYVTPKQAEVLRKKIHPRILTVGVFVNYDTALIKELYESGVIDIVQLHGEEDDTIIAEIRALLPDAEIWQAFRVRSAADLEAAKNSSADRVLLDNGCGTGACFDWSLAADFDRPLILAGGLTPDNLASAIAQFQPFAVDISSGVETEKVKDREKILAAVKSVRDINTY